MPDTVQPLYATFAACSVALSEVISPFGVAPVQTTVAPVPVLNSWFVVALPLILPVPLATNSAADADATATALNATTATIARPNILMLRMCSPCPVRAGDRDAELSSSSRAALRPVLAWRHAGDCSGEPETVQRDQRQSIPDLVACKEVFPTGVRAAGFSACAPAAAARRRTT